MSRTLLSLDRRLRAVSVAVAILALTGLAAAPASAHTRSHRSRSHHYRIHKYGALDCNGYSRVQRPIKSTGVCTDIRGLRGVNNDNTWNGRFFDNGHYIGHDEPDMAFSSNAPGSGNDITWTETLPHDPSAMPTVATPGSDVVHWFELTIAPWFGMALCNSSSYPLLPCTAKSDENAPSCPNALKCSPHAYPGGGSSFLEMQFYPPGDAPFPDNISCDNTHWCASLHINDLECTLDYATCNPNCEEPTNFAFIQRNGVPTGPPSPQDADLATSTPNGETLLMNPGDQLKIHIWDAPVPGEPGQMALETSIEDLTTGQSGFMQASAKNGYMATSIANCSGTPFNYQPEYNTAKRTNVVPWAALQMAVSTEFEIGHFEPCTSLSDPFTLAISATLSDTTWNRCRGPYEDAGAPDPGSLETGDALCYPAGDTHGALSAPPNEVTGCEDNFFQNGDLDFDGTSYWPDFPVAATPTDLYPGSFVQNLPTTKGRSYTGYFIQTDTALSEGTCEGNHYGGGTPSGCAVPPPTAPGKFYPYWTRVSSGGSCVIEFGNVSTGDTHGKDAQYGTNQFDRLGYPEFEGPTYSNSSC